MELMQMYIHCTYSVIWPSFSPISSLNNHIQCLHNNYDTMNRTLSFLLIKNIVHCNNINWKKKKNKEIISSPSNIFQIHRQKKCIKIYNWIINIQTKKTGRLETYGRTNWQQYCWLWCGSVGILHVCRMGYFGSTSCKVIWYNFMSIWYNWWFCFRSFHNVKSTSIDG